MRYPWTTLRLRAGWARDAVPRFGSRAGPTMVLLDEDERRLQEGFLFVPPPLGPGPAPSERLLAYGRERPKFVQVHGALLSVADRDPQTR